MAKKDETQVPAPLGDPAQPQVQEEMESQSEKVAKALSIEGADATKIEEGERAVRLRYDIAGGLGDHKEGTVLRRLSYSAWNTLHRAGGHRNLEAGTDAGEDAVDTSQPQPITA